MKSSMAVAELMPCQEEVGSRGRGGGGGGGILPSVANCVLAWQRCDSTQAFGFVFLMCFVR